MFAERVRLSLWSVLTLAPVVAGVVIAAPTPPAERPVPYECRYPAMPERIGQQPAQTSAEEADALYRKGDFASAARLARGFDQNLAELYDQFALQLEIGLAPSTNVTDAVPALREAGKLDAVLGGAYSTQIAEHMSRAVPAAAVVYDARHDHASARRMVELAALLGLHHRDLTVVERHLATGPAR